MNAAVAAAAQGPGDPRSPGEQGVEPRALSAQAFAKLLEGDSPHGAHRQSCRREDRLTSRRKKQAVSGDSAVRFAATTKRNPR